MSTGYTVPLPSHSTPISIEPDIEEEDSSSSKTPLLPNPVTTPSGGSKGKGKSNVPSTPVTAISGGGGSSTTGGLSGNIGSGSNGQPKGRRQDIGGEVSKPVFGREDVDRVRVGIRTETRYSGADTLDEPVSETIVRGYMLNFDFTRVVTQQMRFYFPTSRFRSFWT
jgi:protein YIPF6